MKVSILVPIYNVSDFIQYCCESLFSQTYDNIEYIFVNDCTPDNSIELLDKCVARHPEVGNKVKVFHHSVNRGLAASRLTGLENVSGDAIMFLDSDDYLEPDAVETLVDIMKKDNSDVVSAGYIHEFGNGKTFVEYPPSVNVEEYLLLLLERKVKCNIWARLYKKELFEHDVNFIEGINNGEDYVVVSRLFYYANKITNISKPILHYLHFNSSSYSSQYKRTNLDQVVAAERYIRDFYKKIGNNQLLEAHYVGNLKLKSEQIVIYLRSDAKISEDYNYILSLFPNESADNSFQNKLHLQDRLILKLAKVLPAFMMRYYVKTGFALKQVLKLLKWFNV